MKEVCRPHTLESSTGQLFKNVILCEEIWVDPNPEKTLMMMNKEVRSSDADTKEEQETQQESAQLRINEEDENVPEFIQEIEDVLGVLRASTDFLRYMGKVDMSEDFEEGTKVRGFIFTVHLITRLCFPLGQNYTAIIPFDEAFRVWYPIDWGFNPFSVNDFVK